MNVTNLTLNCFLTEIPNMTDHCLQLHGELTKNV